MMTRVGLPDRSTKVSTFEEIEFRNVVEEAILLDT